MSRRSFLASLVASLTGWLGAKSATPQFWYQSVWNKPGREQLPWHWEKPQCP